MKKLFVLLISALLLVTGCTTTEKVEETTEPTEEVTEETTEETTVLKVSGLDGGYGSEG